MPEKPSVRNRRFTDLSFTDPSFTHFASEPPPEPPDLWDPSPTREYNMYSRAEWGARPPLEGIKQVEFPIKTVIYTAEHEEYTPVCKNKEDCVKSLKHLQALYMDVKKRPDIPYNFILGGDGNIYEGRGWNKKPEKSSMYKEYEENTIDIGMITHFVNEPLKKRMALEQDLVEILIQFIKDHLDDKVISTKYNLEGFTGVRKY